MLLIEILYISELILIISFLSIVIIQAAIRNNIIFINGISLGILYDYMLIKTVNLTF